MPADRRVSRPVVASPAHPYRPSKATSRLLDQPLTEARTKGDKPKKKHGSSSSSAAPGTHWAHSDNHPSRRRQAVSSAPDVPVMAAPNTMVPPLIAALSLEACNAYQPLSPGGCEPFPISGLWMEAFLDSVAAVAEDVANYSMLLLARLPYNMGDWNLLGQLANRFEQALVVQGTFNKLDRIERITRCLQDLCNFLDYVDEMTDYTYGLPPCMTLRERDMHQHLRVHPISYLNPRDIPRFHDSAGVLHGGRAPPPKMVTVCREETLELLNVKDDGGASDAPLTVHRPEVKRRSAAVRPSTARFLKRKSVPAALNARTSSKIKSRATYVTRRGSTASSGEESSVDDHSSGTYCSYTASSEEESSVDDHSSVTHRSSTTSSGWETLVDDHSSADEIGGNAEDETE